MATTLSPPRVDGPPEDEAPPDPPVDRPARRWYGDGLALLAAGITAFEAASPIVDNSFMTHLATGRLLVDGTYPRTNPFLYSSTDFPMPSWWWSGVLGVVDRVGSGAGIRLLTALLGALLGALLVRIARPYLTGDSRDRLVPIVVPVACAVIVMMPFLNARPQLPGYLLLGVTVLVVVERRSPWWLVPVFATWLNVHGTWVYGLIVLAVVAGAELVDRRDGALRARLTRTAALGGAAVLGVLVGGVASPEPLRLVGLPLEQFGDERARLALQSYQEWKPAGWDHPLTWVLLVMCLLALLGAVRRRAWGAGAGALVLTAMGMSAGRLLPLAVITLVPWAAAGLVGIGSIRLPRGAVARALGVVGVALMAVAVLWIGTTPAYDLQKYPVKAVDWLEHRGLVGTTGSKVLSRDYIGNYLDLRFGTHANTFVDDRPGTDALLDYAAIAHLSPGWRQAFRRADPDVVLWTTDERNMDGIVGKLDHDPGWYRAGDFGDFTVFCRSSIADRCR